MLLFTATFIKLNKFNKNIQTVAQSLTQCIVSIELDVIEIRQGGDLYDEFIG